MDEQNGHLPCGADLGVLADQIAEDRAPTDPAHQQTCPHCQEALSELDRLWGDVRELAHEEVKTPGGLLSSVMERVRHERAESPDRSLVLEGVVPRLVRHALLHSPRGTTQIAQSVIATLVRRKALATPGVRSIRAEGAAGLLPGEAAGGLSVSVEGAVVSAEIGLVVEYGVVIPELVMAVRERIGREVEELTGLSLSVLEVRVVDVAER